MTLALFVFLSEVKYLYLVPICQTIFLPTALFTLHLDIVTLSALLMVPLTGSTEDLQLLTMRPALRT